jgi:hypothetical protein
MENPLSEMEILHGSAAMIRTEAILNQKVERDESALLYPYKNIDSAN